MLLINRTRRGVSQKERPPKVTTTKIRIVIRSFDHPFFENPFFLLPPYTRKIGLPESRVLYTVLRSPHIDKKSREQFEMEIKKKCLVIKTKTHELRKKFFRLKRRATRRTSDFLVNPKRLPTGCSYPTMPGPLPYLKKKKGV